MEKMALNAKVSSSSLGDKMLAVSSGKSLNVVTINQEQIQEKGGADLCDKSPPFLESLTFLDPLSFIL